MVEHLTEKTLEQEERIREMDEEKTDLVGQFLLNSSLNTCVELIIRRSHRSLCST